VLSRAKITKHGSPAETKTQIPGGGGHVVLPSGETCNLSSTFKYQKPKRKNHYHPPAGRKFFPARGKASSPEIKNQKRGGVSHE